MWRAGSISLGPVKSKTLNGLGLRVWMLRNIAYGICLRAVGCGQFARILTRPVVTHA